jgi:hypothetical protein
MKRILFLIVSLIMIGGVVWGQPFHSNTCAGLGVDNTLTINGACGSGNITNNTNNGPAVSCGTTSRIGYYRFTTTVAQQINISITATNRRLAFQLFTGGCASTSEIACVNDITGNGAQTETYSFNALASTTYIIKIVNLGNDNNMNVSSVCVTSLSPPTNDNCAGATALTPGATCTYTAGTTAGATTSGLAATCGGNPDDDVWYSFVATATSHIVNVAGAASFDAIVQAYSDVCGSLASIGCSNVSGNGGTEVLSLTGLTIGTTYRVRVYHNGAGSSATPTFNICVTVPPANDNCTGAINVPLSGCASPLAGTSLSASQSQAGCSGTADDDVWYSITASATGVAQITVASSASYDAVVQVFTGTCGSLTSLQCVNVTGNGGTETVTLSGLTNGQVYFIRVYHQGAGSGGNTFTICATDVVPCFVGTGNVTVGAALPYSQTATTCGQVNDLTSTNVTNFCGSSSYYNGEDVVYNFTPSVSGNVTINLTSGGTWTGLMVHEGCPTVGGTCVASAQSSTGNKTVTVCVTAGVTYYVIVDSWPLPTCNAYTISISAPTGGGAPANDLPCNAEALTLGVQAAGNNSCTSATGEPGVPACWSTGVRNTVWYSVVAPASGQLRIRTFPTNSGNPLQNPQIAVYTGACGAGMTFVACNDNAPSCGGYTQFYSTLTLTGLTPGQTYFIVVDGNANSVGSFEILAIDGLQNFPNVPGQDCTPALPVCNATMTTGNPGFQAIGANCDFTGAGNCTNGEANSVWYEFTMATDGDILFNIVPNDFGNPNPITGQVNPGYTGAGAETDYDWVLWKVSGAGATNCAAIASSGGDGEIACNFSFLGVTGTSLDGNGPAPYGTGFNAAYEPAPFGLAGETYLLVIQNFSNSTSGFSLQFGATPLVYNSTGPLYWSGGGSTTNWETAANWGGCGTPDCARDAFILSASAFQPDLTNTTLPTVYNVRNLTIAPGASLTIQSNVIINICGDLTNNGNLICLPGSTVNFVGTGLQTVSGSFVGADAFHHFTVTKASGSVFLANDITVNGNLTTANATSVLNTNGRYIRLGGNFVNNNGNATYSNTGTTGTLDFIGTGIQNYNQGSSQLDLNFVIMNNTGGLGNGVNLLTNMFIKTVTGSLTLNVGTITTGANRVDVANSAVGAVSVGNTTSFVDGNLRRALLATGEYNWALGNVAKGYQRARTTFSANTYPAVDARFDVWPAGLPIQGGSDCATTFSLEAMDNGYWTLNGTAAGTSTYNMSLFPLNVTNAAAGWTIMKQATYNFTGWLLNGVCAASTVTQINRNNMTNFSVFGIAQAPTPLPIELLEFGGVIEDDINRLYWTTASEINNDYFNLERSRNGFDFEVLATIQGAGNSTSILNYERYDFNPFPGISYYRLKQTDFDGQFMYSQTIALSRSLEFATVSDLFPNPANTAVNFDLNTPRSGTVLVKMYDNTGRLIQTRTYDAHQGSNSFNLDIRHLATGVYRILIDFDQLQNSEVKQLIKQ